ncbi:hypothetical protein M0R45_034467 [Rubus argutus]|uniref:Uncharacterized protein n=1 Tax=Rubus argutus TaxID=59490 RepID=A0AAW1VUC9_RUBAR
MPNPHKQPTMASLPYPSPNSNHCTNTTPKPPPPCSTKAEPVPSALTVSSPCTTHPSNQHQAHCHQLIQTPQPPHLCRSFPKPTTETKAAIHPNLPFKSQIQNRTSPITQSTRTRAHFLTITTVLNPKSPSHSIDHQITTSPSPLQSGRCSPRPRIAAAAISQPRPSPCSCLQPDLHGVDLKLPRAHLSV